LILEVFRIVATVAVEKGGVEGAVTSALLPTDPKCGP
jgi:hypothetical protein